MNTKCKYCVENMSLNKDSKQIISRISVQYNLSIAQANSIYKRYLAIEQARFLMYNALDDFFDNKQLPAKQALIEDKEYKFMDALHTMLEELSTRYENLYNLKVWSH